MWALGGGSMKRRLIFLLCISALVACGRQSESASAGGAAVVEVREHAPSGDPSKLPKVPADSATITAMLRERFGESIARNIRVGVDKEGNSIKVSLIGEVPNEEIRQAVMKELEARVPQMTSEDFTL